MIGTKKKVSNWNNGHQKSEFLNFNMCSLSGLFVHREMIRRTDVLHDLISSRIGPQNGTICRNSLHGNQVPTFSAREPKFQPDPMNALLPVALRNNLSLTSFFKHRKKRILCRNYDQYFKINTVRYIKSDLDRVYGNP